MLTGCQNIKRLLPLNTIESLIHSPPSPCTIYHEPEEAGIRDSKNSHQALPPERLSQSATTKSRFDPEHEIAAIALVSGGLEVAVLAPCLIIMVERQQRITPSTAMHIKPGQDLWAMRERCVPLVQ